MPITDEHRIAELQEDWEAGLPLAVMAQRHGYNSEASIRKRISYLRSEGFIFEHRKRTGSQKERDALDKKVASLLPRKMSRPAMADELGVSLSAVSNSIARLKKKSKNPETISTNFNRRNEAEDRRLISMYITRVPLKQIAQAFGLKSASGVTLAIQRLRDEGYRIPHRRK